MGSNRSSAQTRHVWRVVIDCFDTRASLSIRLVRGKAKLSTQTPSKQALPMEPAAPQASVVIVSWNSVDDLRTCLQHLQLQTERRFETIVVDNASSDGSPQMVRAEFPQVIVEDTGDNLGF